MSFTVYWDVLWTINFMFDWVILMSTSYMMAKKISLLKTSSAAAFGATFALTPLFNCTAFLYNPFCKIIIGFIMVCVSAPFSSLPDFLNTTFFFFMISFLAGGMAFAFNSIGNNIFSENQVNFLLVIFAVISIAVFIKISYGRLRTLFLKSACKLSIRINIAGKVCHSQAIIDTGNELTAPFSGKPIIIVNANSIVDLLPPQLITANDFECFDELSDEWKLRVQIVPFNALGSSGILVVIKPDKIEITLQGRQEYIEVEALVGLAKQEFGREKDYTALVGAQMLRFIH